MTYELKCKGCEYNEEMNITVKQYTEILKTPCKKCGGEIYQNMNHAFKFILKGEGWAGGLIRKTNKHNDGSQKNLDAELARNDYYMELPSKDDKFKRQEEKLQKQAKQLGVG